MGTICVATVMPNITFRVHVQAVSLAVVAGSHIVVTNGDVKGVTSSYVVTQ